MYAADRKIMKYSCQMKITARKCIDYKRITKNGAKMCTWENYRETSHMSVKKLRKSGYKIQSQNQQNRKQENGRWNKINIMGFAKEINP